MNFHAKPGIDAAIPDGHLLVEQLQTKGQMSFATETS